MLGHKGSCLVPRGFRHVLEVVSVSGFSDFSEDQLAASIAPGGIRPSRRAGAWYQSGNHQWMETG